MKLDLYDLISWFLILIRFLLVALLNLEDFFFLKILKYLSRNVL